MRSDDGLPVLPTGDSQAVRPHTLGDLLRRAALAGLLLALLGVVGCGGASPFSSGPSTLEPFSQLDLTDADHDEGAANDSFAAAETLPLAMGEDFTVTGRIESSQDVDIYDLGAVQRGDHVIAQVFPEGDLEGAIALFDAEGHSLLINDSRNVYLGRLEPFIDLVFRQDGAHAYLVVASTVGSQTTGAYTLAVRLLEGAEAPEPNPQTVLLNFAGAQEIGFGGRPDIDIPPFDAADISARLAGTTGAMVDHVVELVRGDYQGLDVVILSTSEGAADDGDVSRVHFGTYDPGLLGVAEGVDEYNASTRQDAIVFTDTFSAFEPLAPSADQMATAIANVASHEIGHLLGLVHTSDAVDIMDITASLSELMVDQVFATALIHPTVFLVGQQDAPSYLADSVGGNAVAFKNAARLALQLRGPAAQSSTDYLHRGGLRLGSCGNIHGRSPR